MRRIVEEIPPALDGERLDKVVAFVADVSRAEASRLVADGSVRVDDAIVTSGKMRIATGQVLALEVAESDVHDEPRADPTVPVTVVHVDDDIVVVDKSPDLVVHPAPGHRTGTLVNGLLALFPGMADVGEAGRPGIVHRLDAGTSGLMVVARTQPAYETLVGAIAAREVGRIYWALVWGHLESDSVVVDAPIGRSPRDPSRMAVRPNGKPARTGVSVIEEFTDPSELTLVECRLESGRTHQIRVHLAAIGHPVVGDALYGGGRRTLSCSRPMLHSRTLELNHPVTGIFHSWTVDPPADMARLLGSLGRGAPSAGDQCE
jgi:23S rRNA pseudouridine1911/1915/1917 synthase